MKMPRPSFTDAVKIAEQKLSRTLEGKVNITYHNTISEKEISEIHSMDNQLFREELWYSLDELVEMFNRKGFLCILLYLDDKLVAYDFGFDETEKVFFSDSTATLIERRGIGTLLVVLELIYLYERDYQKVRFKTEEMDQNGRPLREIWEKRGYRMVASDEKGLTMELIISESIVNDRVERYL